MEPTRVLSRRVPRAALTVLAALALALAYVVAPSAGPASAATIDTNTWYVLVNQHSGKAMEIGGGSSAQGAEVTQFTRNDTCAQQWRFLDSGGGYYRLQNRCSGLVAEIYEHSVDNGAQVVQWSDLGNPNQQFSVQDVSGNIQLVNRNSGKALDLWGWSTADGARISQYDDTNAANQQWRMIAVDTAASYPNPGPISGDTFAHDPTVIKRTNGEYLLAFTANGVGLKTSADRTTWNDVGAAFPNGTPWADEYTGGNRNLWAPELRYANGQYYLWYSASTFESNKSAIFLATSPSGASGTWTNRGVVIESDAGDNFNAIDPAVTVDQSGNWWMSFGSFWSGIKMIRLDPSTGMRSGTAFHSIASRGGDAIEAPTIHYRNGYYYLFVSFDRCCQGTASTYRVMVGRSTSITGPYVDRAGTPMTNGGGTQILASHGSVHGPGHQTVLADSDADALFYHYYRDDGRATLGINLLRYDDGWPSVY
ncbi:family 43 glycosylhydrolase [Myceligenerans pegani]|uniref:Family 43 glycosylhydrolase n=1 Tax=Myceligenerans pegani TaxID=2776917 RepID=A0ABR9MUN8_9MICO|nr:family 43 glycosylhydrolase [Myceligenerans sp. TRM 65318]MBE1875105.1 family 43 glycosylhydrolase [Myceligenerans sp. TRM 65318]MBE3017376.1 family 43 glycosylhydrolase [Myceligenerans sp. TRM 65318]